MWWIPVALAHDGGVPEPIAVHAAGDRVGVETTLGWFERGDSGWSWSCPQPLLRDGALSLPRYALRADGLRIGAVVVAGDEAGAAVQATPDGCAWRGATGIDGIDVGGVTFGPDGLVWLAADAPGGVSVSADDGATFTSSLDLPGWRVRSVVAADDGVWAAAGNPDAAALWRLRDGVWTSAALPATGDVEVLAASGDRAWVRVDPFGSDHLLRFDGVGFETVLDGDGLEILDVAITDDGRVWAVVGGRFLYRSDDDGRSFVRIEEAPEVASIAADGDTLWLATRLAVERVAVMRLDDGVFTDVLDLRDALGPLDCPVGTVAATVCDPRWDGVRGRFPGLDTAEPDTSFPGDRDDPDGRCGCVGAPAASPAWLLVAALAARRRQNQRPSTSPSSATTT